MLFRNDPLIAMTGERTGTDDPFHSLGGMQPPDKAIDRIKRSVKRGEVKIAVDKR